MPLILRLIEEQCLGQCDNQIMVRADAGGWAAYHHLHPLLVVYGITTCLCGLLFPCSWMLLMQRASQTKALSHSWNELLTRIPIFVFCLTEGVKWPAFIRKLIRFEIIGVTFSKFLKAQALGCLWVLAQAFPSAEASSASPPPRLLFVILQPLFIHISVLYLHLSFHDLLCV